MALRRAQPLSVGPKEGRGGEGRQEMFALRSSEGMKSKNKQWRWVEPREERSSYSFDIEAFLTLLWRELTPKMDKNGCLSVGILTGDSLLGTREFQNLRDRF